MSDIWVSGEAGVTDHDIVAFQKYNLANPPDLQFSFLRILDSMIKARNVHHFVIRHTLQAMHKSGPGIGIKRIHRASSIVGILWVGEGIQLSSSVVEAVHRDKGDFSGKQGIELAQKCGAECAMCRSLSVDL